MSAVLERCIAAKSRAQVAPVTAALAPRDPGRRGPLRRRLQLRAARRREDAGDRRDGGLDGHEGLGLRRRAVAHVRAAPAYIFPSGHPPK